MIIDSRYVFNCISGLIRIMIEYEHVYEIIYIV